MGAWLTDPKVLTVIFGAIGAAFAWLWGQVSKALQKHRECELEVVKMKAEMTAMAKELGIVQGTCSTLTELLRKDISLG